MSHFYIKHKSLSPQKKNSHASLGRLTLLSLLFVVASYINSSLAASRFCVVNGGNWSSTATWSATSGGAGGASVPIAGDDVTIENALSVVVDQTAFCASLVIIPKGSGGTGTTLSLGAFTLTVSGNVTLTGAATSGRATKILFTSASGVLSVGGNVNIGTGVATTSSAILDMSNGANLASNLLVGGTITRNTADGLFTTGTGSTVNYNGTAAQTISFTNLVYNNLTITNSHASGATLGAAITATNVLGNVTVTGTNALLNTNNLNITLAASKTFIVAVNATVNAGTSVINTTGAVTIAGTFKTANLIGFNGSTTTAIHSNAASITLNSTSTIEYNGANQAITSRTYGGNLIISGSTGTVTKSLPGAITVTGNFSSTQGGATTVTYTAGGAFTFSGNVTIGSGTIFEGASFTHTVAGSWTNNGTFTGNTSTVTMNGASSTISGSGTHNFNNLTLNAASITSSLTTITLLGNLATTGSGTFTHTVGTLTMSGTTKTISGTGILLNNLTISGTVTSDASFTVAGNLVSDGSLTTSAGAITMSGASKVLNGSGSRTLFGLTVTGSVTTTVNTTISSALTVSSGSLTATAGTFTFTGGTITGTPNLFSVTINGSPSLATSANLGIAGTYTITSGSLGVASTPNTVTFNSTGAQSIPAATFNNLVLSNGSIKSATGILTVNNDFTISSSTAFRGETFSHSIAGNWTNNGDFVPGSSTITLSGTSKSISGSATDSFFNLTVTGAGLTTSLTSITISGNLATTGSGAITHSTGTLTMSGATKTISGNSIVLNNLTVNGTVSAAVSFTVAGNLSVNGTLTTSSGSITMSGTTKTLNGSGTRTFNGLIVTGSVTTGSDVSISSVLTVSSGTLTASAGTFTFTGTSTITGTPSLFNVTINGTSLILAASANLTITGTYTVSAGSLNATSNTPNTVTFSSSGAQNIPSSTFNNLTITNGNTKTATGALTVNNTFTIGTSTTFAAGSFTHSFTGNLANSGTFDPGTSTVALTGTGDQDYSGAGTVNNLTVNKASGTLNLTQDLNISSTLTMTSGTITLGNFDLNLGTTGSISGGSASAYIIATGSGEVIQRVTAGGSKTYPVGLASAYIPVTIALSGGSTADNFSIRLSGTVLDGGTSGSAVTSDGVGATWFISEGTGGGSTATLTFTWPAGLEMSGFDRTISNITHWDGTKWDLGTAQAASGSGPYSLTRSGITGFSPFGVGEENGPLPVTWKEFKGKSAPSGNLVEWTTASEHNAASFELEASVNGTDFTLLRSIAASGFSTTDKNYSYFHSNATGTVYYRIRQVDNDGKSEYSKTIVIESAGLKLTVFPNPAVETITVSGAKTGTVNIIDAQGRLIRSLNADVNEINISDLAPGVYFLQNGTETRRFVKTIN